jgi:deazaflavin-dependent oxidoreductase (nitroreductase family)
MAAMDGTALAGCRNKGRTREYADVGAFKQLVRRTAASRPITWLSLRLQRPADRLVHRLTHGRTTLSSFLSGLPVVMLTTTGARTGARRTHAVLGFPDRDRLIVIASNYGLARHPGWYHNLRAHPRAVVSVRGVARDVTALELTGRERDRCFSWATRMHPGFVLYRQRAADRRIPVFRLDPIGGSTPAGLTAGATAGD